MQNDVSILLHISIKFVNSNNVLLHLLTDSLVTAECMFNCTCNEQRINGISMQLIPESNKCQLVARLLKLILRPLNLQQDWDNTRDEKKITRGQYVHILELCVHTSIFRSYFPVSRSPTNLLLVYVADLAQIIMYMDLIQVSTCKYVFYLPYVCTYQVIFQVC